MAFAFVQKSAAVDEGTTSPRAPTLPVASTSGNLLIACVGAATAGAPATVTTTFPAGWVRVINSAQPTGSLLQHTEIWNYINNPGGISSVSITISVSGSTLSNCAAVLLEVSGAATTPGDATGTTTNTGLNITPVTSANLAGNNDLAVTSVYWGGTSTSAKVVWTPGAGWTNIQNDGGTKQGFHFTADYRLDTGSSAGATLSEVEGIDTTSTMSACIATWKTVAAAAQIWQPPRRNVNQAVKRASTW